MSLANDGLFREMRYFTPWQGRAEWVWFDLPAAIKKVTGQDQVKFGDVVIKTNDTLIGTEMCEELFTYVFIFSPFRTDFQMLEIYPIDRVVD